MQVVQDEAFYVVSIHAPRVGYDIGSHNSKIQINVSIHAPRAGCDL